jgi:hypothetical protein
MVNGLIERIIRESAVPDLLDVLAARLTPTDLQSILLEVYRRRADNVTPARLLEQYASNRFVAPSPLDPRRVVEFERRAWALLPPAYAPIELAPVCPLGTTAAVATVDQNKVLTTIRNTEVVADTTNVLALEAAVRRRKQRQEPVLLAASQRVTRTQVFEGAKSFAHFRLLALVAAGRDTGSFTFESTRLIEQLGYFLNLLRGLGFTSARVGITPFSDVPIPNVLQALPTCYLDPTRESGRGYYHDVCFKIYATDRAGEEIEVGDGGMVDWTQQLLADRKERLLIGALGVERLCLADTATP